MTRRNSSKSTQTNERRKLGPSAGVIATIAAFWGAIMAWVFVSWRGPHDNLWGFVTVAVIATVGLSLITVLVLGLIAEYKHEEARGRRERHLASVPSHGAE